MESNFPRNFPRNRIFRGIFHGIFRGKYRRQRMEGEQPSDDAGTVAKILAANILRKNKDRMRKRNIKNKSLNRAASPGRGVFFSSEGEDISPTGEHESMRTAWNLAYDADKKHRNAKEKYAAMHTRKNAAIRARRMQDYKNYAFNMIAIIGLVTIIVIFQSAFVMGSMHYFYDAIRAVTRTIRLTAIAARG